MKRLPLAMLCLLPMTVQAQNTQYHTRCYVHIYNDTGYDVLPGKVWVNWEWYRFGPPPYEWHLMPVWTDAVWNPNLALSGYPDLENLSMEFGSYYAHPYPRACWLDGFAAKINGNIVPVSCAYKLPTPVSWDSEPWRWQVTFRLRVNGSGPQTWGVIAE